MELLANYAQLGVLLVQEDLVVPACQLFPLLVLIAHVMSH